MESGRLSQQVLDVDPPVELTGDSLAVQRCGRRVVEVRRREVGLAGMPDSLTRVVL